ncbi:F-box associated ubiquitination effector family protein, partial [Striga hermonthica]
QGFRVEIPEFDGGVDGSEFVDWWAAVEATLSFKEVPDERRVALVATCFRGRAAVWWMNVSSLRHRQGKQPLSSWIKFRELVEREFVPFIYDTIVYQQLQNLRQGTRSVNDYTMQFRRLLTRVALRETKNQLVARYVGGLRAGIRETLNMFRPESASDAHQRALLVELQFAQKAGPSFPSSSRTGVFTGSAPPAPRSNPTTAGGVGQVFGRLPAFGDGAQRAAGMGEQQSSAATSRGVAGHRCFGCGEPGHRQAVCPKISGTRALFADEAGEFGTAEGYEGPPDFDAEAGD